MSLHSHTCDGCGRVEFTDTEFLPRGWISTCRVTEAPGLVDVLFTACGPTCLSSPPAPLGKDRQVTATVEHVDFEPPASRGDAIRRTLIVAAFCAYTAGMIVLGAVLR